MWIFWSWLESIKVLQEGLYLTQLLPVKYSFQTIYCLLMFIRKHWIQSNTRNTPTKTKQFFKVNVPVWPSLLRHMLSIRKTLSGMTTKTPRQYKAIPLLYSRSLQTIRREIIFQSFTSIPTIRRDAIVQSFTSIPWLTGLSLVSWGESKYLITDNF